MVDADSGVILGLLDVQLWERHAPVAQDPERTIDEKESRRWLVGAEAAAILREAGAISVTVIADREGDLYPAFARRPPEVELLVRAQTEGWAVRIEGSGYVTHQAPAPGAVAEDRTLTLYFSSSAS